jgi:hypothetical protein
MQEAAASGYLEVFRKLVESPNAIGRCFVEMAGYRNNLRREKRGVTGKTRIYILAGSYLLSC